MKAIYTKSLKIITLIVAVSSLIIAAAVLWDNYRKYLWTPEQPFHGLTTDMTISDVYFRKGEPNYCSESKEYCWWGKKDDHLIVTFKAEKVSLIHKRSSPFGYYPVITNVEHMIDILGAADIISISESMIERRYTYLKWGATFGFEQNKLTFGSMGEVKWRKTPTISEYYVNGKIVCPSTDCPFDSSGKVKPEYIDKTYRDFL